MKRELEVKSRNSLNKTTLKYSLNNHAKYYVKDKIGITTDINPVEIISEFCSHTKTLSSLNEINKCFNKYTKKLGYNFIGLCVPNKDSNTLKVKTYNEKKEVNTYFFSLNDEDNYLVQTYLDKSRKFSKVKDLADINCTAQNEYITIPLIVNGESEGIIIAGAPDRNLNRDEILNILCNYIGIFISNYNLRKNLDIYIDLENSNTSQSPLVEEELVKQLQDNNKTSKINLEIVTSLAAAIDAKDTYTKGHSHSVSLYSESLAKAIGLDEHTVEKIKLAAVLHDIGKIGISETLLRKPGPLTDHEWEVMKQHPIIGVKKIIEPIKSLNDLADIVRHHHERIDGFGYPDKIKGDEIPLGAKIVAIADAFHALISNRPYRKALNLHKAIEILKSGAGTQWDKTLVEKFILIIPSFQFTHK